MYLPIWILYWFPVLLIPNYAIKFGLLLLAFCLTKLLCRSFPIQPFSDFTLLKGELVSFVAEFSSLIVLYILEMKIFPSDEAYFEHYFTCSLIAFFVAVVLSFSLHYAWTFSNFSVSPWKRLLPSFLSAFFTAPYMFLVMSP